MIWTTEKPTKPEWYWWRDDKRTIALACYVEFGAHDACVSFAYGQRYKMMSEMSGEWSSEPIPRPKEPA